MKIITDCDYWTRWTWLPTKLSPLWRGVYFNDYCTDVRYHLKNTSIEYLRTYTGNIGFKPQSIKECLSCPSSLRMIANKRCLK